MHGAVLERHTPHRVLSGLFPPNENGQHLCRIALDGSHGVIWYRAQEQRRVKQETSYH